MSPTLLRRPESFLPPSIVGERLRRVQDLKRDRSSSGYLVVGQRPLPLLPLVVLQVVSAVPQERDEPSANVVDHDGEERPGYDLDNRDERSAAIDALMAGENVAGYDSTYETTERSQ